LSAQRIAAELALTASPLDSSSREPPPLAIPDAIKRALIEWKSNQIQSYEPHECPANQSLQRATVKYLSAVEGFPISRAKAVMNALLVFHQAESYLAITAAPWSM
jgi:hypothetical protein